MQGSSRQAACTHAHASTRTCKHTPHAFRPDAYVGSQSPSEDKGGPRERCLRSQQERVSWFGAYLNGGKLAFLVPLPRPHCPTAR